jgi:hypothetical protein
VTIASRDKQSRMTEIDIDDRLAAEFIAAETCKRRNAGVRSGPSQERKAEASRGASGGRDGAAAS